MDIASLPNRELPRALAYTVEQIGEKVVRQLYKAARANRGVKRRPRQG
ncbi:MAG: hypothetical protein R3B89_31340 [Polyangiaceae bacterium]